MLSNILYLSTGLISIIGLLFKFLHWPGAGILVFLSLALICITLLEYLISNLKSKLSPQHHVYPFLGIFYVLGVLFKLMHWPGANIMLIVSIIGLSCAFLGFAFNIRKSIYAIFPILYSVTIFFVLFRILHWPEPPYILYGSYFLFTFLVPVFLFSISYRLKNIDSNLSNHFMVLSILSFILCLVEYKLKLFPEFLAMEEYMHYIMDILLLSFLMFYIRKTIYIEQLKLKFQDEYKFLQCLAWIYMTLFLLFFLISAN